MYFYTFSYYMSNCVGKTEDAASLARPVRAAKPEKPVKKEKVDKAQMRINEENLQHKGAWLTKEVCEEYRKMAEDIKDKNF